MSVLAFLTDPQAPVSTVRGRRALTREERAWLDAVPAVPVVEFGGQASAWVRSFFCGWVRHGLEQGIASVRTAADGSLVATMPAGLHTIRGQPEGVPATRPGTISPGRHHLIRRATYVTHSAPID